MNILLEKYSTKATVTKIRAMYSKMLTKQDYERLMEKQSVSEIASYLKTSTHYSLILSEVDTVNIHRGFLESLIRRSNFDIYEKLCKFQHLDNYKFYNYEIVREETEQILSSILHLNSDEEDSYIEKLPTFLIEHSKIDFIKLGKVKNFRELLDVLKGTPYFKILKDKSEDSYGKIDYLDCEIALRTFFYQILLEAVDKDFDSQVADILKKNIKVQIDLINMINAFRMKAYFSYGAEDIKKSSIPFFGQISKKKMFRIYDSETKEKMIHLIDSTRYARQMNIEHSELVEKSVFDIRYKSAKSALRNAHDAPVAFYSFMYLCEVEAINLVSIIEGIRYNSSPSYIQKLLVV